MKHLYRFLLMALAFVWADLAWAQDDEIDQYDSQRDTTYYYIQWGDNLFNIGVGKYNEAKYSEAAKNFENAINKYELYLNTHPQEEYAVILLRCHLNRGLCYFNIQNKCKAYEAFSEALSYDLDLLSDTLLTGYYKKSLYYRSLLLFDSHIQSIPDTTNLCGDTKEIPAWDTCIGDQQLDRCIDDLNRLVGIEQNGSDDHQIDSSALVLLGNCYYYKGEQEKAKECFGKSGNPNLYDELVFLDHYYRGVSFYNGDSINNVKPDYCGAFQEFEKAIDCDINYHDYPQFDSLYKTSLYLHAYLLFLSHIQNFPDTTNLCGDTKEIPAWDTCIGDHQLDRCIDDLNRIILLGQAESDKNNLDTMALVLLGECHYYKKEYIEAIACYKKSGMSPEQLDVSAASCFWSSYLLLGINEDRLEGRVCEAYRNNYALYHLLYRDVSDDKMFGKEGEGKEVAESLLNSVHLFLLYFVGQKEYYKAYDFWLKIKNNFSLSPILLMDQALCRLYLGDFSAISDFAYAYNLLNSRRVPDSIPSKEQLSDDEDIFKTIKDAYNEVALSALYIEKNYEDAREYYSALEHPTPEETLMLGVCYKNLNKEDGAKQRFYEVISKEDSIGKISETPYAYLFLGESDKAVESMEQMLKTGFPSKISNEDDSLNCFGIHYQAAEIYAKVGMLEEAQWHISKSLEYSHDPFALAIALKMPLLDTIRDYVEQEVNRYSEKLGILESKIQRDTIVCDIPFKKSSDYTRTIKCKFQMNDSIKEIQVLFDPGADKCQFNIDDANSLGITNNDIIACIPLHDANGNTVTKPLVSLNKVIIGDIELENVQAVIDSTSTAHSLLGCTVLNNLKVEMPSPVNKGKMRFTYIKESIEIPENKKTLINNEANETLW